MPKKTYECDYCGEEYKSYPSWITGENNFCSRKCKHLAQEKENQVECEVCGEKMYRRPSRKERSDYFVCSDECKSEMMRGSDNPNWDGAHDEYRGKNWQEMRRERKERDNHECVLCGKTEKEHQEEYGRELEVAHVRPFKEFEEPEDAHHINNLLTLCVSCHRMVDRKDSFQH